MVGGMFLLYIFIVFAKVVYVEKIKCTVRFALLGCAVWLGGGLFVSVSECVFLNKKIVRVFITPQVRMTSLDPLLRGDEVWSERSERVGCSVPTLWCAPQT